MRLLRYLIAVLILSTGLGGVCLAEELITVEQAKAAVRQFEGDPGFEFDSVDLDETGEEYNLESSSRATSWVVDAATGEVVSLYNDYGLVEENDSDTPFGPLTKEQCRQIAIDFARSNYADFDTKLNTASDGEWYCRSTWRFDWGRILPNGAETRDCVSIEVSPVDGAIRHYVSHRVPEFSVPAVTVTCEESIQLACTATGIAEVAYLRGPYLCASPDGVKWAMVIGGGADEVSSGCFAVDVDAATGEVTNVSAADGTPSAVPSANRTAKSAAKSRLWVRLLPQLLKGTTIAVLDKHRVRLTVDKRAWVLVPGNPVVKSQDREIHLTQPPVIRNGRMLVPLELAKALMSKVSMPGG